jgi:hypothetical protein
MEMKREFLFVLFIILFLSGCGGKPLPPITVTAPVRGIDYVNEVQPILTRRCVVCHSCYNSPCQLKLDSFAGLDRGATKRPVYDSERLHVMDPTRLFIDANTTEEWRQKKFYSVTMSHSAAGSNDSILLQLLSHKKFNPSVTGDYFSEKDLTCVENKTELGTFLERHPNKGMPFGFPPLPENEFQLIAGWLAGGGHGPTAEQMEKMAQPSLGDIREIMKWETFLNKLDAKYAMTARYLYEHLFLSHIRFSAGDGGDFYELVRSTTGPNRPIEIIPSVRPYDDPGVARFWYRFRKIHSTIVHKTHMVFPLNDMVLARCYELFIEPKWDQEPNLIGYQKEVSAHPFLAFAQIPTRSRYQFLLDNAHYIIKTFIHGPVCKGQIALNVIHDHFWVMFLDPDHDLTTKDPSFLWQQRNNLRMPIEEGSDPGIFDYWTNKFHKAAIDFYRARQDLYAHENVNGLDFNALWKGNKPEDAPLLTIFRHFESASVHKGALGRLPRTMWVIDYPLLERIYYALVAGFDVFGNFSHQLGVRLYMDALRIEGEGNFLDFLPPKVREETLKEWYKGLTFMDIGYFPTRMPTGITYRTNDPKREFIEYFIREHIRKDTGIAFDPYNYLASGEQYPSLPKDYSTPAEYIQGFRAVSAPGIPFLQYFDDHNANNALIRIRLPDGSDQVISAVVHRWHDNVKFLIGEEIFQNPSKDQIDFFPGFIGSYPNYFFDVQKEDVPDFLSLLKGFTGSPEEMKRLDKYGLNRADPNFWEEYDWFQTRFNKEDPINSGLLDLNRYYHKAR